MHDAVIEAAGSVREKWSLMMMMMLLLISHHVVYEVLWVVLWVDIHDVCHVMSCLSCCDKESKVPLIEGVN